MRQPIDQREIHHLDPSAEDIRQGLAAGLNSIEIAHLFYLETGGLYEHRIWNILAADERAQRAAA